MSEREPTGYVPKYPMIPEEFGDYDRLDFGHPGGMGVVYKVLNRKLNVERALKVLRPDVADRMPVREAFIREANFGAQLAAGPYILPVHRVGTLQGWDFIEMDWVEGPNLAEFLREKGRLDPWAAMTLGAMVLDALNYAHRAKIRYPDGSTKEGIIHRDIKPANILIDTRTARPLLSDFGIALAREAAKDRQGGYTAGTINYLPPELIQDRPVDERSDIYQVGLVLYELLSGLKAFPGGAGEGVNGNIVAGYKKRAIRLERHESKLETAIVGIVERSLELDPDDRVQSAGEMRDEIRAYLRRRYADHDQQQAFRRYLKDGSVPGRRMRPLKENKFFKFLKKLAVPTLWGLLVLAVVVGGYLGGKYGYMKYFEPKFIAEYDRYRAERGVWDQQSWDDARVEAVGKQHQEIARDSVARNYRAARDRCRSLADQLRDEVDPLRKEAEAAQRQYEEERSIFELQKPPKDVVDQVSAGAAEIENVRRSGNYIKIRDIYRSHFQFPRRYDSLKLEEFRTAADQRETARKSLEEKGKVRECRDSAAAYAAVLSRIRQKYEGARLYQDGIDTLAGIKIPMPGWRCRDIIPDTSCVPTAQYALQEAQAKLREFKNLSGWEKHVQSWDFSNCSIKAVEGYLSDAERLLGVANKDCAGVLTLTDSGIKCLDQLKKEWKGPVTIPDDTGDVPIPAESLYVLGKAAYEDRQYQQAIDLLIRIPPAHEMYRPARFLMAHSECYQGDYGRELLRLYEQAGTLCEDDNVVCYTCKLLSFDQFQWCDSVEIYYGMVIGTGKLKCDKSSRAGLYSLSLISRFNCAFKRYQIAKAQGAVDDMYNAALIANNCYDNWMSCFGGDPGWSEQEEILREKKYQIIL